MEFNPSKCEHFLNVLAHFDYQLCGHTIQKTVNDRYLGVIFDQHLTWKAHIDRICDKANSTKAFLQRNISHCPMSIKINCYQSFVRAIYPRVLSLCTHKA